MKTLALIAILLLTTASSRVAEAEEPTIVRMPAEFEPQVAVWMIWPQAEHVAGMSNAAAVVEIVQAIAPTTPVKLAVANEELATAARQALPAELLAAGRVTIHELPAAQFWTRDMGPNYVETVDGLLAIADFKFNGWGYGEPSDADVQLDEAFDRQVAKLERLPVITTPLISEGGDREANGRGTLLVVEAVELGRNPGMSKSEMEAEFKRVLGVQKVIWLGQGLREDDHSFLGPITLQSGEPAYTAITTNGHVDEFARFVSPRKVLLAKVPLEDLGDPIAAENHRRLEANYARLKAATDQDGQPLEIVRVPLPRPTVTTMRPGDPVYDFLATLDYPPGTPFPIGRPIKVIAAASYLNFLITDRVVVAPQYGGPDGDPVNRERDRQVMDILQGTFPERKIVTLDVLAINFGGGGIHCITMHQPRLGSEE
jgi:agmatine deiminase